MTIAVGFICSDGIVLAADTKESYGEAGHTYVNKLVFGEASHYKIGLAGAGVGYPLDYISPRILDLFATTGFATVEDARARLEQLVVSIYSSPAFLAYPDTQESLKTEFLVAVHIAGQCALLLIESTLVTRIEEARVVGSGFMQQMATELGQKNLTVEQASIAALYLIYETKRRDGYVGGVTHIYKLYSDGRFELERTWDQSARESLFESLRQWNYRMVVTVSSTSIQPWDYKELIESFTRNMRSIRGEYRRIEQRYQRWMAEQAAKLVIKPKKLSKAPKRVRQIFKSMNSKPSDERKSED